MDPNDSFAVYEIPSKINKHSGRNQSRSLSGYALKGLCETIPISLPPSQRLLMFVEQWYHRALSLKKNELMDEGEDIDRFRQKADECWEKIKASIEENNLANLAVARNKLQDKPLHSNDEEYNKTISVFEAESEKWDKLISQYRDSLQKTIDSTYVIEETKWRDHDQLYNYSDVIKSTSSIQETLPKKIASLTSANRVLKKWTYYSKTLRQHTIKKAEKSLISTIQESPRTALQKMSRLRQTKMKSFNQSVPEDSSTKGAEETTGLNRTIQPVQ